MRRRSTAIEDPTRYAGVVRRGRIVVVVASLVGAAWLAASCTPTQLVTLNLATCEDSAGHTTYTLTNGAPYPLDVNYVSVTSVVLSTTHLEAHGGAATVTAPGPGTYFQIWYTFEGGPTPTASTATTVPGIGSVVAGARPLTASPNDSAGPPPVASGIVAIDKFACVGTAATD
jgi:hypothetical protein